MDDACSCDCCSSRNSTNGPSPRGLEILKAVGPFVVEVIRLISQLLR